MLQGICHAAFNKYILLICNLLHSQHADGSCHLISVKGDTWQTNIITLMGMQPYYIHDRVMHSCNSYRKSHTFECNYSIIALKCV